ncbi:MAG: NAD(P)/FAD-dependent oxidoreductase, partial [Gammaproteobacteria bacterium]
MRIAVIGTGISGLSAAWLLHRHAEVTVYEQNAYAGGHTNTVDAPDTDGPLPVDTGFIVFNERNYPNLTRLFRLLGVKSHASDMSFAASIDNGQVEWAGDNLNTVFAQRRNLFSAAHWRMLRDILRFNRDAKRALLENIDTSITLGKFLDQHAYSDELRYCYLLPMAAAIWSCPMDTMLDFPARSFLHFCDNHCLLNVVNRPQWRTVTGGSREYVRKLMQPLGERLQLNSAVVQVKRTSNGVRVKDQDGHEANYDRVVMAAHADQSLAM